MVVVKFPIQIKITSIGIEEVKTSIIQRCINLSRLGLKIRSCVNLESIIFRSISNSCIHNLTIDNISQDINFGYSLILDNHSIDSNFIKYSLVENDKSKI